MGKIIKDNWPDLIIWALTILVFVIIFSGCRTQDQQDCCDKHVITEDGINWYTTIPCEDHKTEEPEYIE